MRSQLAVFLSLAFHLTPCPVFLRHSSVIACCTGSVGQVLPRQPEPEIDAWLFLTKEILKMCGVESVVLLTSYSVDHWAVSMVLELMQRHTIRMMHFDGITIIEKYKIDALIWDTYVKNRLRNYILIMPDPRIVVEGIQRVFESTQRGEGALMPHQISLLVIAQESERNKLLATLTTTSIDNVAVAFASDAYGKLESIHTLMWRANRRREFVEVRESNIFASGNGRNCRIFPNKQLAMNGRPLEILAKEWLSHLYKTLDKSTGKLRYDGLYVDVIETMSKSLNFTYVLTPEPGEDDNITWADFATLVGGSFVDLGATTYISNSMMYYNHTVTYPLLWSNVSGVYLNRQSGGVRFPLWQFKVEVYICLLCTLALTMIWYLLLLRLSPGEHVQSPGENVLSPGVNVLSPGVNVQSPGENVQSPGEHVTKPGAGHEYCSIKAVSANEKARSKLSVAHVRSIGTQTTNQMFCLYCGVHAPVGDDDMASDHVCSVSQDENVRPSLAHKCDVNKDLSVWSLDDVAMETRGRMTKLSLSLEELHCQPARGNSCSQRNYRSLEDHVEIFFQLLGSIFNQDNVPCPPHLSARLLLWSWCSMVLVLTATFTGNITAELVGHQDSPPFTTFEELLKRGDYKWGLFGESSFFNVMKNAKNGSTLKELYDRMMSFSQTDPTVLGSFEQQIVKLKTENFVTFFFSGDLEYLKERSEDMSNLVIITDHLMTINMGFVCPKNSKLSELISEELLRMTETGVLDHLLHRKNNSTSLVKGVTDRMNEGSPLDVKYLQGLLYCCGCGVILAFCVLILEIVYMKMCEFVQKVTLICC